jgi:outer membrane protein OmpA-like peptidoglycan-associated protein
VTLNKMKDAGAAKYAPNALLVAEASHKALSDAIERDPRNNQHLSQLAATADDDAAKLARTVQESKYMASLPPEERAKELARLQSAEKQRLAGPESKVQDQSRQIASLEREAEAERRYRAAAEALPEDQARVARQGDQLLIRLTGLGFATGKSAIPDSGKELLDKVAGVIGSYGPDSRVTVHGRTDSTGSPGLNKKLSMKRAEAVKDYLVSNGKVSEDRIDTKGISDSRPVATNRTPAGRKENRGVDVMIIELESQRP